MARRRFVALDGLRGIAALLVVLFHAEAFFLKTHPFARHGYLAVDLFFMLSGFVIGAAYEKNLGKAGNRFWRFILLIRGGRLWPLIVLGVSLGVLDYFVEHFHDNIPKLFIQEIFLIPAFRHKGYWYPLDNVLWSLFFELFANVAHYFILRRIKVSGLALICLAAGGALAVLGLHHNSLNVGFNTEDWSAGLARVSFSYTAGLMLYRLYECGRLATLNKTWWLGAALVVAAISAPTPARSITFLLNDLAAVFLIFPAVICLSLAPIRIAAVNVLAEWSGALSYPLYVVHYPLIGATAYLMAPLAAPGVWGARLASLALIGLVSWGAFKWYDQPIQALIRRRFHPPSAPGFTTP